MLFILKQFSINLDIQVSSGSVDIITGTTNTAAKFTTGSVQLYQNNSLKFFTRSAGAAVVGILTANGLAVTGVSTFSDGKISFSALGDISGRYINLDQGNGTKYIDANLANSNSISLRGYVGGSYQFLADFTRGGACGLNFNGNRKLETSNTGIDVTGEITADDLRTDNSKTFYLNMLSTCKRFY